MAGSPRRAALVVASYDYADQSLSRLRAPGRDADELARTLADPTIGAFDVSTCVNEPSHVVRREIARFYADRGRDDLLLLYFSGHGIKDQGGRLFFAMRDTERELPDATAIPANFVNDRMHECRARTNLLVLDCCFAGAFARGLAPKGDVSVHAGEPFAAEEPGAGRVVLTASDAMQYAFEGDQIQGDSPGSVFTSCLVRGLRTGAADLDRDGEVSITEIYDYVYEQVRSAHPQQRPLKWEWGVRGRVVLARNPSADVVALPPELTAAVSSTLPSVRLAAVDELAALLKHPDRRVGASAREALESLSRDDSRQVATRAASVSGPAPPPAVPAPPPAAPPAAPKEPEKDKTAVLPPMEEEPPARPAPVKEPPGRPTTSRRTLVGIGAVAAVVVVTLGATLVAAGSKEKAAPPTTTAAPPTTVARTLPSIVTVTTMPSPSTTLAPVTTRATPTTASAVVTHAPVFELRVGECFNPSTDNWLTVPVVPCSSRHIYEVVSNATTRWFQDPLGTPWAGKDRLHSAAKDFCAADFADYVGISYYDSRLEVDSIVPEKAHWDSGGRHLICLVIEPGASPRVGSAAGIRQ